MHYPIILVYDRCPRQQLSNRLRCVRINGVNPGEVAANLVRVARDTYTLG